MTKKKEKEEDVIEEKNIKKEMEKEVSDIEHSQEDFELAEKLKETEKKAAESADAKALADKYLDGWKRCQADFENYKKRQSQSQQEFFQFANAGLIMQILPVIDNFHMSTDHIPEEQKNSPWVVGIMHIQKQLEQILKDNNVSEIEVKEGDKFDPAIHEAVSDNQEKKEVKNKIEKIVQRGYKIGDKVIRPARVVVE